MTLEESAEMGLRNCMGLKRGESVLVVTDEKARKLGYAIWRGARNLGAKAMLMEMVERESHGAEPPRAVAEAMKHADVIMVMMMSLSHTQARKEANERGARIATSVMLADEEEMTDIMERGLSADYERIKERTERLALRLTNGRRATVKTPWGTDVTMSIEGRAGEADTGIFRQPGSFGNLPAGEAYIAPVEGSANGTIAIDMVMTGVGWFESEKTLILKVKEGYVVDVEGESAPVLSSILATYGKAARNIAELGVGTNDRARANKPIECEKTMGTVHMALGDNSTFGGVVECPVHLDGIMSKPTLTIDDEVIIEDGEYLL